MFLSQKKFHSSPSLSLSLSLHCLSLTRDLFILFLSFTGEKKPEMGLKNRA